MPEKTQADPGFVTVRVLKHGDGKIATGKSHARLGDGDIYFARNDTFSCALDRAVELEAIHYIETVDG
jgi:hypothetical protein